MEKSFFIGLSLTFLLVGCKPASELVAPLVSTPSVPDIQDTVLNLNDDFKLNCEEARFVKYLNLYRASKNLTQVLVSQNGVESSRFHAEDMIQLNYFSHTEPNGRAFYSRASAFNYDAWSENIAAGNATASATFCQWKNSSGHNTNMLTEHHRSIGIGRATGSTYGYYWSNNFGPSAPDLLSEPLTEDSNCSMPTSLPNC